MRIMQVDLENGRHEDNVAVLVPRMVFPDDDRKVEEVESVMAEAAKYRIAHPNARQGMAMESVEDQLVRYVVIGRMTGDVFLKLIQDRMRGERQSLEHASSFISEFYTRNETKDDRYPTDVTALQKKFRFFKNSIHYWAAWQILHETESFNFVTNPEHLESLMVEAGGLQDKAIELEVFPKWDPWCVPEQVMQRIHNERRTLDIPEPTEFERKFRRVYRNKMAR